VPDRNEMYFWCVDEKNIDRKIWQTKNGGGTWTQLNDDNITNCGDVFGGCGTQQGTFNLELAAVPDGEVTDLYAGLANLFKCRLLPRPPCVMAAVPTLSSISGTLLKSANHEGHEGSQRKAHSPAKQLDLPLRVPLCPWWLMVSARRTK
jgi:hypothetical protein